MSTNKNPFKQIMNYEIEKKIKEVKANLLKAEKEMKIKLDNFMMKHLSHTWFIKSFDNQHLVIDFNNEKCIDFYYSIEAGEDFFIIEFEPPKHEFNPIMNGEYHEYIKGIYLLTKPETALEFKQLLKTYSRLYSELDYEIFKLEQQLKGELIDE